MKAESILRMVSGLLQDLEPDVEKRWPWENEDGRIGLLDFLNNAIRAVVLQRPELMAVTEKIRLEPGMRQSLPCPKKHGCRHKATMLIELVRNVEDETGCPGPAILSVNNDVLLMWASALETGTIIENYAYDRMTNPNVYMVYPAVPYEPEVWVEATFSIEPCEITDPCQEISLPDDYGPVLIHHMLAAIFAGDNESSSAQKAAYHQNMYNTLLGIKTVVDCRWPKAKSSTVPGGGQ